MPSSHPAFVTAVGRATGRRPRILSTATTTLSARPFTSTFVARHALLPLHSASTTRIRLRPSVIRASAQTQQETPWNDVNVVSVTSAADGHTLLTIDVGTTQHLGSLTDSYRVPGMFVQLRPIDAESLGIKPSFFAISSPPTLSGLFEFLIKDADSTAWINDLSDGDVVQSSPVMGKGFPISTLPTPPEDILLFATGSGIAPIRAAIESMINGVNPSDRRSVTLFYGARSPEVMAYSDRFDDWAEAGINVVPVISRPELAEDEWSGRTGYVQAALEDLGIADPANTAALLCGVKGMAQDVKSALIDAGVPESNILFNF